MRWLLTLTVCLLTSGSVFAEEFDLLVYGATPAGIAAALSAGRAGDRVLLVDPSDHPGGMVTNGLSHPDFRTFEGITGFFLEFTRRVEAIYESSYGKNSPQWKECLRGTHAEPKVNLAAFQALLSECPKVRVEQNWELEAVRCSLGGNGLSSATNVRSLEAALFYDAKGERHPVSAHYFVDATYEGDLMAAAEVPYALGREGRAETQESLAPLEPDDELQGYNFRIILTQDASNRVMPRRPEGYDRGLFADIVPLLENKRIPKLFDTKPPCIFKAQIPSLPNGKFDINDVSKSLIRLSLPGENWAWPDGDAGVAIRRGVERNSLRPPFSRLAFSMARERISTVHRLWMVGLLYFLQNDPEVPLAYREEARSWGFARDEFSDNHHFPAQLYVREARRMKGVYVYSQRDTDPAPGDARSTLVPDAIAMGDYGLNCHGTAHHGSRFNGSHTGEFYKSVAPYQIPYGVLLPKNVDNLLVPVALSATHVGFCALRFEPIWSSLGEAAGHAAHLANARRTTVQAVSIDALRARLHSSGAGTLYVSDVLPTHPDFAAVQWWGAMGGLHGLAGPQDEIRGKNISGQYYEAYPGHAAELEKVLDQALEARWLQVAKGLRINLESLPVADGKTTRGEWIRSCWASLERA